jgi:hypothetical protein
VGSGRYLRQATILACLTPGGCGVAGENAHIYPGLFGQRVVGNEVYVTVSNVYNEMDALPLATQHCATYGKVARFDHMEQIRAVFDCVPRE